MSFRSVCKVSDLWEGEMEAFEVDGEEVLVVWSDGGEPCAFQGMCPHQDIPLIEGQFDGKKVLTCRAHQWTFDASSGQGINPAHACLARYPVKVENGEVLVDVEGVKPLFAQ